MVAFALDELAGLFGGDIRQAAHAARAIRPGSLDAFANGSYSCALPGHADDRLTLVAPVDERLYFAGEACSINFFGTAHARLYQRRRRRRPGDRGAHAATRNRAEGMMATYVLVHGAWSGGYTWQGIAKSLRRAGHEVYTPTLTGLGERSHLLREGIDLDTHIMDVRNLIRFEDFGDIVLVGHSYAGMVVTGVADAMPEKIATLVYLDAFVPENGQSLADFQSPGREAQPSQGIAVRRCRSRSSASPRKRARATRDAACPIPPLASLRRSNFRAASTA